MSWPRRSDGDEEIERVARALEAAAHGAPDSPRAVEIRAHVLEGVSARGSRGSAALTPVMVVAVAVVLALIVAIGAPAVGSLVRDLARPPHPDVAPPSSSAVEPDDAEDLRVPMRTPVPADEAPLATASPVTTTGDPSSEGGPQGTPTGTVTPAPGGPPDPRPTGPPFPIPTPPVTGPPPGLP